MQQQSNMGHITDQYGPYYRPIWAILLTNMGHIALPHEPCLKPLRPLRNAGMAEQ